MIKKFLAILLCAITLMSTFPIEILAWTSNEGEKASSREGEDYVGYDGEKYYYLKKLSHVIYDSDGDVDSLYTFRRTRPLDKYYLKHDGKEVEAFCIEAGVSFGDSDEGYTSKSYKNSDYFNNLPSYVKEGIMTALIYGWTSSVPSELKNKCNLDDYRLATQLIIWEYQQQLRTSPTKISSKNGVDADTFSHAIEGRPAEYAYDYILNKMKNHKIIPSFCNNNESKASTYKLKYDSNANKYILTLTDNNNTLVDLKSDNKDISIKRNGNKYTFTSDKMITKPITISVQKNINNTSDAMLIWGMGGKQTMTTGCSDFLEFYLSLDTETYGILNIKKDSEDGKVEGIKFTISGNNQKSRTVTTGKDGTINVSDLLPGTYKITEEPIDKYIAQQTKEVTIQSEKTTKVTFKNTLKKFRVNVKKEDSENVKPQGDATLEGAIYGIYENDKLIDEYTTDKNGEFTTKYYVCGDNWTIKEITPSEGYNLNEKSYHIGAEAKNYTVEYNNTSNKVTEDVIKGKISIIKHTDNGDTQIETPESGAKFEVYLKSAKSFEKAKDTEKDVLVCDEDGFSETKELPYGTYVVHQISGWDNRELAQDFEVQIKENNKTYRYLINNHEFESYVKFIKVDKETKKEITLSNATFSLYKLNEKSEKWEQVKCKVGRENVTKWTTGFDGLAFTETKLPSGKYKVEELETPNGFIKLDDEITFEISMNNPTLEYDDDWDAYISVTIENDRPKANLEVNKVVAKREDVDTSLIKELDLSKIRFKLTAREDIINPIDGNIIFKAGDEVGVYNTDKKGHLEVEDLNLGKYELEEIETLPQLILNTAKFEVDFNYENDTKKIYTNTLNIENKTTLVQISKTDITGKKELEGAKLEVTDKDGNIVDEWISTTKSHKIEGLIAGETYTLTEKIAPEGYELAESIEFTVSYDSETPLIVMKDAISKKNNAQEIYTGVEFSNARLIFVILVSFIGILIGFLLLKKMK